MVSPDRYQLACYVDYRLEKRLRKAAKQRRMSLSSFGGLLIASALNKLEEDTDVK